jgi:hypothetical protein
MPEKVIGGVTHSVDKVTNTAIDGVNTIVHMPEKVIGGITHTVDKVDNSIESITKSPVLIIGGLASL